MPEPRDHQPGPHPALYDYVRRADAAEAKLTLIAKWLESEEPDPDCCECCDAFAVTLAGIASIIEATSAADLPRPSRVHVETVRFIDKYRGVL